MAVTATSVALAGVAYGHETVRRTSGRTSEGAKITFAPGARAVFAESTSGPVAAPAGGATQGISVRLEPGPLIVFHGDRPVTLRRASGGSYVGTVKGIRVADARLNDAGWRALARLDVAGRGRVRLHVRRVTAFARSLRGLRTFDATMPNAQDRSVASARVGNSAGTFDLTIGISWTPKAAGHPPARIGARLSVRAA